MYEYSLNTKFIYIYIHTFYNVIQFELNLKLNTSYRIVLVRVFIIYNNRYLGLTIKLFYLFKYCVNVTHFQYFTYFLNAIFKEKFII